MVILLFVKEPVPGKVKTRLAQAVGIEQAAQIYRELVALVCSRLPEETPLVVAFDPPDREDAVRAWFLEMGKSPVFIPQAQGDLGERLIAALAQCFLLGYRKVTVIGSDCPEIAPEHFEQTRRALEEHDVVLGPVADGGYYLMGLKKPEPQLFKNIPWSTDAVYRCTLEAANQSGLSVLPLAQLEDIDTVADWIAWRKRSGLLSA